MRTLCPGPACVPCPGHAGLAAIPAPSAMPRPACRGASSGGKRAAPTKEKEQQNVGEEVGTPAAKRACRAESACSSGSNAALATGSSPAREQGLLDCLRQLARKQRVAVVCTNKDGNKKVGE